MATNIIDVGNNTVTATPTIAPIALATASSPVNGAALDMNNAVWPINFHLCTGVFTSPGTLVVKIQEAIEDPDALGTPLSSDWSDVSGAVFTTVSASASSQWIMVKNVGTSSSVPYKRFVRAVATIAGGGGSVIGSVICVAQKKKTGVGGGYSNSPQV